MHHFILPSPYDEIYDTFFPKDLLKFPEVISGYYVSNIVGGIMVSGEVREKDRVGVAYSGEQAKGIQAFCELSHILLFLCTISFYRPQNQIPTLH
jgi:hypothetical protein